MGRPKGSRNFLNQSVKDTAHRLGINFFESLCYYAKGDWKALGYETEVMVCETNDGKGTFLRYTITPEMRLQAITTGCKYMYAPMLSAPPPAETQQKTTQDRIAELIKKKEELSKL